MLAPESEFQVQAAYSPSPSPPPSQQSGRSLRQTKGASELPPRAVPASAGLLPPPPGLQFFGKFGGGWRRVLCCHCGAGAGGPARGDLLSRVKTLLLSLVRSLQLPSPETRHSFPDHLWPGFPEGLRGSQQSVVWGTGCRTDQPCADGNVLALLCPLWS